MSAFPIYPCSPLHHFLLSIPSSHWVGHLGWDVSGSCNSNTIFCGSLTATLMFEHEEGPVVKEVFLDFGVSLKSRFMILQRRLVMQSGNCWPYSWCSNHIKHVGINQLVLIDFGFNFMSTLPEDKADDYCA